MPSYHLPFQFLKCFVIIKTPKPIDVKDLPPEHDRGVFRINYTNPWTEREAECFEYCYVEDMHSNETTCLCYPELMKSEGYCILAGMIIVIWSRICMTEVHLILYVFKQIQF